MPRWLEQLGHPLQKVRREVCSALQHDLRYFATVGCRTALDIAEVGKVGDIGHFCSKVNQLVTDNHISDEEKELILAVSDAGDGAAHRGFQPKAQDLMTLFDVLERVLNRFCIKPEKDKALVTSAQTVRSKVPKRAARGPGAKAKRAA